MFEKLTHSTRNELEKQALCYGAMTEEILAVLLAYFVTHHKTPLSGGMFLFLFLFFVTLRQDFSSWRLVLYFVRWFFCGILRYPLLGFPCWFFLWNHKVCLPIRVQDLE